MKDKFNREINYLRLSITYLCNLKCKYCTSHESIKVKHEDVLSVENMINVVKACSNLGVTKLRITGGEPLVRKGLVELIKQASSVISNIGLTTNGIKLKDMAVSLKEAGLTSLNVSLDTLDPEMYKYLTLGSLKDTLEGLKISHELGFKLKLNSVLQKGINDENIDELAKYAKSIDAKLRFIELMPFESTESYFEKHYISADELIKRYDMKYLYNEGVAEYYKYKDYEIGFIRPISNKFCSSCNRIRITSFGEVIPCLHSNVTYSIKDSVDDITKLQNRISEIIMLKPERHFINEGKRQTIDMVKIGG